MKRTLLHRGGGIALAMALMTGATGCAVNSPTQTMTTMTPSDGFNVDVADLHLRNVGFISGEADGPATLLGSAQNASSEPATLTLQVADGGDATFEIAPGASITFSHDGDLTTVDPVPVGPGDLVSVTISDGSDDRVVELPVLDPTGYYENIAPEGWTPTPTPTEEHEEEEGH